MRLVKCFLKALLFVMILCGFGALTVALAMFVNPIYGIIATMGVLLVFLTASLYYEGK